MLELEYLSRVPKTPGAIFVTVYPDGRIEPLEKEIQSRLFAAYLLGADTQKSIKRSAQDYEVTISEWVTSVFNGNMTASTLANKIKGIIRAEAQGVYVEGMLESGEFESESEALAELDDTDEQFIDGWKETQLGAVDGFAQDVAAAASKKLTADEREQKQRGIIARVGFWGSAFAGLGAQGKMNALKNEMGEWELGATEQHCEGQGGKFGCADLAGTAHRMKYYTDRGLNPGVPGSNTQCGGFRCECKIRSRRTGKVIAG